MIAPVDPFPPRGQWLRALLALPACETEAVAARLTERYRVCPRALPQSGLGMLAMREPNLGQRFLLGEFPLATAEVELEDDHGQRHLGAARLLHDSRDLATAAATCDAALAADLPGSEEVRALVARGWQRVQREDRVRSGLLTTTTVDFSRLEVHDDDDE